MQLFKSFHFWEDYGINIGLTWDLLTSIILSILGILWDSMGNIMGLR